MTGIFKIEALTKTAKTENDSKAATTILPCSLKWTLTYAGINPATPRTVLRRASKAVADALSS